MPKRIEDGDLAGDDDLEDGAEDDAEGEADERTDDEVREERGAHIAEVFRDPDDDDDDGPDVLGTSDLAAVIGVTAAELRDVAALLDVTRIGASYAFSRGDALACLDELIDAGII